MAKSRIPSGDQVCAILECHGFVRVRQRVGHMAMQLATDGSTKTVPVPNHAELHAGPLRSIIRQSRLSKSKEETRWPTTHLCLTTPANSRRRSNCN
ncbi:MAG: type II toxin-antitoxin system HicA family toxin [Planctomycetota bacterium]